METLQNFIVPDRFIMAALTLLFSIVIGFFVRSLYPAFWGFIQVFFGGLCQKLNRAERKPADLVFRSFMVGALVVAVSITIGVFFEYIVKRFPLYGIPEIVFLSFCVSTSALWRMLNNIYRSMREEKPLGGAYKQLSRGLKTDLNKSDHFGLIRKAITLSGFIFDKGMVAPLFWYLVLGLPGAYVYAGVTALAFIMNRQNVYTPFSAPFMAFEKLMGVIPSLLTGILLVLAAVLTPTASFLRPLGILKASDNKAGYYEGGLPLSIITWSLKITLNPLFSRGETLRWIGPKTASAQVEAIHLRRMAIMSTAGHLWGLMGLLLIYTLLY